MTRYFQTRRYWLNLGREFGRWLLWTLGAALVITAMWALIFLGLRIHETYGSWGSVVYVSGLASLLFGTLMWIST
jgi:hypothetical protein